MARGKLFAKAHFRGIEHISSMVELITQTPEINGLDICVFREIGGRELDLLQIGEIIDGRFPFSLEYGDTDDGKEVIDFLNPAKRYMLDFVREKLIPAANKMNAVGINFHLVANAQNIRPFELPPRYFSRQETIEYFRTLLTELQQEANCPITVENVHCLSTRRMVDDCIKFSPVGNIIQDLFDLGWPVMLDTAHLGMSLFTYQVLLYLEERGHLRKIPDMDYVWCPTQIGEGQPGPYLVRFGVEERNMVQLLPRDLTEATMVVMKKLHQNNCLRGIHLSNLPSWTEDNLFLYWDNDDLVEGTLDLPRILKFAYELGITVIAELRETNFCYPEGPGFRANLLRVVEMLKILTREAKDGRI